MTALSRDQYNPGWVHYYTFITFMVIFFLLIIGGVEIKTCCGALMPL